MNDWFALPEFQVDGLEETNNLVTIRVSASQVPSICEQCGYATLIGHGRRTLLIADLPHHQKPCVLQIDQRRFRCRNCGDSAFQRFACLHKHHRITSRLHEWICNASFDYPFTRISGLVGITEGTVRNIFGSYIAGLEKQYRPETPRWLGIDEVHLHHQMRGVFTNIEKHTLVEMLSTRSKEDVTAYLRTLKPNTVEVVTMDMWKPYRDAVRDAFPNARIVVDKFHVVRMGNKFIEDVRKHLRSGLSEDERTHWMHQRFVLYRRRSELTAPMKAKLERWTARFPLIGIAYELKEALFDIYHCKTVAEAETAYNQLVASVPDELQSFFEPIRTSFKRWKKEIFNYFVGDKRFTNAFRESMNNLIKVMQKQGRGYSFEVLRARMLFRQVKQTHVRQQHVTSMVKYARQQARGYAHRKSPPMDFESMNFELLKFGSNLWTPTVDEVVEQWRDYGVRMDAVERLLTPKNEDDVDFTLK